MSTSSDRARPGAGQAKSIHATHYPMVPKSAAEPDPKPHYGRMFAHVAAAGVMVAGFQGLSGMAVGKVVAPQVRLCPSASCPKEHELTRAVRR